MSQELLVEHLAVAGYLRQEPVAGPGEFSVRGGIVDVFSPLMRIAGPDGVLRRHVDSIREFDLDDQRSRGPVQHIDILPMQDVLVSREMIRQWGSKSSASTGSEMSFKRTCQKNVVFAEGGEFFPGVTFLLPLAFPLESTVFDYAEGAVLVLDEPEVLHETHDEISGESPAAFRTDSIGRRPGAASCESFLAPARPGSTREVQNPRAAS